jgi:hypothetical protein
MSVFDINTYNKIIPLMVSHASYNKYINLIYIPMSVSNHLSVIRYMPLSGLIIIAIAGSPHHQRYNTSRYDDMSIMSPTNQKPYHYVTIIKIDDSDFKYQGTSLSTWYEQSRREAVWQSSSAHQHHNRHGSRTSYQTSYEKPA